MTSFTTRVELHDATWDDYTKLHEKMRAQGFSRTITSDNGVTYQLPLAEYDYQSSSTVTRQQVLDKAKAAAGAVKTTYEVLVTESNGRIWAGLKQVNARAA